MIANFIAFFVAISILVAVHEYGHFWVARRCGVFVERFSIGFGPVIWRYQDKIGTEYVLSAIPLGGYVKMQGEQASGVALPKGDASSAYDQKSVWARMFIVAAGPLANFIFAALVFWIMFMLGVVGLRPVIDVVQKDSIAAQAGLQPGNEIIAVNNKKTPTWEAVTYALVNHYGQAETTLTVHSPKETSTVQRTIDLTAWQLDADDPSPLYGLGITPKVAEYTLEIGHVVSGEAADEAGLLVGDEITVANGIQMRDWQDFVEVIQENPNRPVELILQRGNAQETIVFVPDSKERAGLIQGYAGVAPVATPLSEKFYHKVQYDFVDALFVGLEKTWYLIKLTIGMIAKLFQGIIPLESLSGPISIAQGAGASANHGLVAFLGFLALLSVNLGVINLLPLPVLDGGNLVFLTIEALLRKPLPQKVQEVTLRLGMALLFTLMGVALFNDLSRL